MSTVTSSPARLVVVLLHWNQPDYLADCLHSLESLDPRRFRLVVVDNASEVRVDWDSLSGGGKRFHLLRQPENRGFAGGNNAGIVWALAQGAERVMLLNTDTRVEPGLLEPLEAEAESATAIGGVCPRIYFEDPAGDLWFDGSELSLEEGRPVHRGLASPPSDAEPGPPRDCYYATMCCMVARADVWRAVGLLDEDLFFRWEDTAWSARAAGLGYRHRVVPQSRLVHRTAHRARGADMSALSLYYETRNRLVYIHRHVEARYHRRFYGRAARASLRTLVDARRSGPRRRPLTRAIVTGWIHFLRGRLGRAPAWLERESLPP